MPTEPIITKMEQIIRENLHDEHFSVANLARFLFLSRTQLYRIVKKESGRSPSQHIAEIRLLQAHQLLLSNKELTITQVADQCGFRDRTYFSRAVKLRFGTTPSDLRKIHGWMILCVYLSLG